MYIDVLADSPTHPSICRNLSSFSILADADVGMRYLMANFSSGTPLTDAMYTELNVPAGL